MPEAKMREPVVHVHTNPRGERVRILGWPVEGAQTALFVHHGLGEHIGRYQTFADHLPDVAIWGYDARGHGQYSNKLGHADGLGELAADLYGMIPVLLAHSGAKRAVLFGQSMGAAVVLTYAEHLGPQPEIAGLVLEAAPVFAELDLVQKIKVVIGRILARVIPAATLATGLPPTGISSVPAEVRRYSEDPLVHDRISMILARSVLDDVAELLEGASKIAIPTLLAHGMDDPIANVEGSKQLHERIECSRLELFEGAMHELHHETPETVERFFELVLEFYDEVLGS